MTPTVRYPGDDRPGIRPSGPRWRLPGAGTADTLLAMTRRPIWLQIVLARFCVLTFALAVISVLLFLLGNLQEFLDSTQVLLLRIAAISSFLYVLTSVYFLGVAVIQLIRRYRVGWHRVVLIVMGLIVALGILLFTNFIQSWIEQVR